MELITIQLDLITKVTEVSVFLLVDENLSKEAMKINTSFALGPLYL